MLLISSMEEKNRLPPKMKPDRVDHELAKIGRTIEKMLDKDLFPWIETEKKPSKDMIYRGATVVADRLTGAVANPIIRNAQERRQLAAIKKYLENRGYQHIKSGTGIKFSDMSPATFAFRLNVPVKLEGGKAVNIPVDVAIMPKGSKKGDLPLLIEAKSAGDFTNVNKRRKEEAAKMAQLRASYGREIRYVLFLCGYFDTGYLGYEAAEGIDWIWEHRIDDFVKLGV